MVKDINSSIIVRPFPNIVTRNVLLSRQLKVKQELHDIGLFISGVDQHTALESTQSARAV